MSAIEKLIVFKRTELAGNEIDFAFLSLAAFGLALAFAATAQLNASRAHGSMALGDSIASSGAV